MNKNKDLQDTGETILHKMKECIMLNNGSTVNLFCNPELIKNIQVSKTKVLLATNAGTKTNNFKATVKGFSDVWYSPDAIANIFGFSQAKKKWRITYDSDHEDAFLVHTHSSIVKFTANKDGLYLYSLTENYRESVKREKNSSLKAKNDHKVDNMISTVAENHLGYTQRQFKHAKEACKLYHTIGMPTVMNFKVLLHANAIKNCLVTVKDVTIAEKIFGPSVSSLKGKPMQCKPNVVTTDVISIPQELITKNCKVSILLNIGKQERNENPSNHTHLPQTRNFRHQDFQSC